jgi:amidophosphoribosyltransferase
MFPRKVQEIEPGNALIIKKEWNDFYEGILPPTVKKSMFFRTYISLGGMKYTKKNARKLILPAVLKSIDEDTDNTVFSYIPNTAETSFYGLVEAAQDFLNQRKNNFILQNRNSLTKESLQELLSVKIRTEKSSYQRR